MSAHTSFGNGLVNVDYASYLSQHDIVYRSPATEGIEGLPIGNGDLTAMLWMPPDRLHWQLNKCDLWDDGPDGNFQHWRKDWEEKATRLCTAGSIAITNGLPSYDWKYLKNFEARLQMHSAQIVTRAETPFSSSNVTSFISRANRCLVIDYQDQLTEASRRQISLQRWGSRRYGHFFHQIAGDPSIGLAVTESGHDEQHAWIVQHTRSLTFAVACRVVGIDFDTARPHSRQAVFNTVATTDARFQVYLAVVTSEEDDAPLGAALALVNAACDSGRQSIEREHRQRWETFWNRSFVSLPDKYVENLWYFDSYQLACCCSGRYPPTQSNGLWCWNGDVQPWNFYYHWNIQQYTWAMQSSGQFELFEPYARLRRDGLEHAMEDARKVFGCRGAWYADISNRKGYQPIVFQEDVDRKATPGEAEVDHGTTDNLTPGAQMAMDLYRHYQYTLDGTFLREFAFPLMREVVRFYCDYLKQEDDGRYHVPKSCPYEGNGLCKDAISDLACIRQLFPAYIDTAEQLDQDAALRAEAMSVLGNLAEFVTMDMPAEVVAKGMEDSRGRILAAGIKLGGDGPYHQWMEDEPGKKRVVFGTVHIAPIFPASVMGLDQRGTKAFELHERTLRCFDPQAIGGFLPYLVAHARMGLKDTVWSGAIKWAENYQAYPQGFFSEHRRLNAATEMPFGPTYAHPADTWTVEVIGGKEGETTELLKRRFLYVEQEPGAILRTTINEMLLQSYSGRIRVFPAVPDDWSGCFVLHAVGGFVVMSEKTKEGISYVAIESRLGKRCCVVNPWSDTEKVHVRDVTTEEEIAQPTTDEAICFDAIAGHIYYVERLAKSADTFRRETLVGTPNQGPKKMGSAVLGKPRLF